MDGKTGVGSTNKPLARCALVRLHNHAHLTAVYGELFASRAMRALQRRVAHLGGVIVGRGRTSFVATLPTPRDLDPTYSEAGGSDWAAREGGDTASAISMCIGSWQQDLASVVLAFDGARALPVIVVSLISAEDGPAETPFGVRKLDPDELEGGVAPMLPIIDSQIWRRAYEKDMAQALALYEAMARKTVRLAFQPIVRRQITKTGLQPEQILYREALLRISDNGATAAAIASGTAIQPGVVVPALERLGLVRALDQAVVQAVVGCLELNEQLRLGCNVSGQSLNGDVWWTGIVDRLRARPELAARLTVEITESAPLAENAVQFVRELCSLGCRIALDDFGAGFSSISFARAVRPQVIKLDGTFVRAARVGRTAVDQLSRLADFCRTLAPVVVVEGVERIDDVQAAGVAGIDWMQGFAVLAGDHADGFNKALQHVEVVLADLSLPLDYSARSVLHREARS